MSQDHFDHLADEYDDVFKPHISNHYLTKRVKRIKALSPGKLILDFGCGTGVLGAELVKEGFSVTGVDYSEKMLERASHRGLKTSVIKFGQIPFDDNKFDLVYSVAVFHHLETKENVEQAISELVRVTVPGGTILIWDHNPLNPYWRFLMPRLPQDHGDERLVPLNELVDGFRKKGVRDISHTRSGWIPEFVPAWSMPPMRFLEKAAENLPVIKEFSAHNIVAAVKP